MAPKQIPEGFHSVTPYLAVYGVDRLMKFLERTVGATVSGPVMRRDDGTIMHTEMKIGDSVVMMGEPGPSWSPTPGLLYVYVDDVDAAYRRALDAGGESISEPKDEFYGDRVAGVKDPTGNLWWLATHVEDVGPEELARRAASMGMTQS